MAKPEQKPTPQPQQKPAAPKVRTARRVRVERHGNNDYSVVEDTYDCAPTSSKVLKGHVDRVTAEYRVRLYLEEFLGPNRHGDSGL